MQNVQIVMEKRKKCKFHLFRKGDCRFHPGTCMLKAMPAFVIANSWVRISHIINLTYDM